MSHSNREKSYSEGSDRHLHEPVQAVLHTLQRQIFGNSATNTPRSDELLEHPQNVPERGGHSEITQLMEYNIIKTSNKKMKEFHKKKEVSKEEVPLSSTSKLQASQPPQEGKKNKKRTEIKHIFPATGSQESKKMPWKLSSTLPEPEWNSRTKRSKE
ncbi:hypothetical protein O181_014336 [Austropuccinia psidii MF-1]|uniref:Uncharacterized protein n=1 Tax=Austropuccinia psidii MF-1 TaxID=1389203 RepID=A0A9Q3C1J3_9BASI|nr:hypothetical protein [Austropuccinia psidii MF-1]